MSHFELSRLHGFILKYLEQQNQQQLQPNHDPAWEQNSLICKQIETEVGLTITIYLPLRALRDLGRVEASFQKNIQTALLKSRFNLTIPPKINYSGLSIFLKIACERSALLDRFIRW